MVVLLVLVLHTHIQRLDELEVLLAEVDEARVRILLLVQGDNEWAIESSLAEQLKLLGVVV